MLTKTSLLASAPLFARVALAGKRGLAWPWYNSPLNPETFVDGSGEVVAIYDWETYSPPTSNGNINNLGWIGMQGTMDSQSSPVADLQNRANAAGWATVFSLNEPDGNGISPADAAGWYQQYINPLNIKKALPAITNSANAGQGLDWLNQFVSACGGNCFFDYINIHWYGTDFGDFQNHVNQVRSAYPNNQIVISEFALQNGGDQAGFFQQAFAWLDSQDFVELYFPFVATSPSLLSGNDGNAANFVGTGSCLFNDDGSISSVGSLMLNTSFKKQKRAMAAWK